MVDAKYMKDSIPKVSIGMPVYNGEKTIRDSLNSLLVQTFQNFEIIISDNASTDGTAAICLEYCARDARIRYIRQPENRGAVANFQFVLDQAKGEYFMWAAADDMWSPNWIATLIRKASPAVLSFGSLQYIDADGKPLGELKYSRVSFPESRLLRLIGLVMPYPTSYNHLIYGLYPAQSLKRIQAGSALGYLPTKVAPNGNEIVSLFLILQDLGIVIDSGATFYYRVGGVSSSANRSFLRRMCSLVLDPIYAFVGIIRLLSILPLSNWSSYALFILYPLVGIFRLIYAHCRAALHVGQKLLGYI